MHERSPKANAIDTLLYERDMLQHCAEMLNGKHARFKKSNSREDEREYYLAIEGFLLHLRNLLGFFVNKGHKPTDLRIDKPERWAGGIAVNDDFCKTLTARTRKVNEDYGFNGADCYQKISWFLQHCTVYRHQLPRSWDIAKMFADIKPVLEDFFSKFAPTTITTKSVFTGLSSEAANSTATMSRFVMPTAFGRPIED